MILSKTAIQIRKMNLGRAACEVVLEGACRKVQYVKSFGTHGYIKRSSVGVCSNRCVLKVLSKVCAQIIIEGVCSNYYRRCVLKILSKVCAQNIIEGV